MKRVVAVRYDDEKADAVIAMAEHRQITAGEMYRRIVDWALAEKQSICTEHSVGISGYCGNCGAHFLSLEEEDE